MRQVTRKGLITIAAAGGVLAMTGGHAAHADAEARGVAAGSPGVLSGNTVQAPVHAPVNACGNTATVGGGLNPAFGNKCANVDDHRGGHQQGDRDGGRHRDGHEGGRHQDGRHQGGHQEDRGGQHWEQDREHGEGHGRKQHGKHAGDGGARAEGVAAGSPGVLSGNTVQAPVHAPVNVCGNSVNVVGALNPAAGNECANVSDYRPSPEKPKPEEPKHPEKPKPEKPKPEKPKHPEEPKQPEKGDEPRAEAPGKPAPQVMGGELAQTGSSGLGAVVPVGAGVLLGGALLYRRARAMRG
ncbi:chaplin [Streptomyces pini]|uniref:Small secreted domain n=1 Tax=Streptomyces pini TaxID=1520580 RepID=A0A1I4I028_9ACTN|nr:chaplin [Streptomyces pini]SFL47520.1 Small secreted domain [Streptomyces pini]